MSKGLEALKDIKETIAYFGAYTEKAIEGCNIIEEELEQAKENEEMLNVFKNALTIEHKTINNIHAFKKDREGCISGLVSEIIEIKQNELDEKLRKSLREWVLKNAFPKEAKALEIIKKSIVEKSDTKVLMGDYYQVVLALTQEEYNLFKEVCL